MDVYDLISFFKKESLPYNLVTQNLYDELLYESRNNEYRLFSNLCYLAAGLGTGLENAVKKNKNLVQKNKELEKRVKDLESEKNKLVLDYQLEHEKVVLYEKTLKEFNSKDKQKSLVKNGMKIAYKASAGEKEVLDLLKMGYSKVEISDMLGVSRNTVYNRIKGLKEKGILS